MEIDIATRLSAARWHEIGCVFVLASVVIGIASMKMMLLVLVLSLSISACARADPGAGLTQIGASDGVWIGRLHGIASLDEHRLYSPNEVRNLSVVPPHECYGNLLACKDNRLLFVLRDQLVSNFSVAFQSTQAFGWDVVSSQWLRSEGVIAITARKRVFICERDEWGIEEVQFRFVRETGMPTRPASAAASSPRRKRDSRRDSEATGSVCDTPLERTIRDREEAEQRERDGWGFEGSDDKARVPMEIQQLEPVGPGDPSPRNENQD